MSDAFEDIFRMIRLDACVYFQRSFHATWAMAVGPTWVAQFHLVLDGPCIAETGVTVVEARPGDVLLFPRGDAHVLADRPGREAIQGADAMASFQSDDPVFMGSGPATRVICGHYGYRTPPMHPIFESLPELVHVSGEAAGGELAPIVDLLVAKTCGGAAGSISIVERLAEVLLVRTLRGWLASEQPPPGFLHAMMDRRLSRAPIRIHRDYDAALSLDELAGEAGMSRTTFSERFRAATGLAAIEYRAKWRVLSAGEMLQDHQISIAEVASRAGYQSDLAFARAFKREYGVTPAEWRRAADSA